MTRIAILRPEPGASETLGKATANGLDAFSMPLFRVEPVAWSVPDTIAFDGLLLTSATAVRMAGEQLAKVAQLPVYAVGPATAEAARSAGLTVTAEGSSGIADLLPTLDPRLRLLHLAGEDRVDADLSEGPEVAAVSVYRAQAIEMGDAIRQLEHSVALVHSPRAARRLAELVDGHLVGRSYIVIAAISPAAAAAAGDGWARIAAADRPRDEALLALAAELCKMMPRP